MLKAARASLERLQLDKLPLYQAGAALCNDLLCSQACLSADRLHALQIHFPFPTYSNEVLVEAMTQLHQEGLIGAVGVCNFNTEQMRSIHGLLAKQGIPLASNQACVAVRMLVSSSEALPLKHFKPQVKFSVLEQQPIKSGLLDACKELDVTLVAHSPLQQGLLTGALLAACVHIFCVLTHETACRQAADERQGWQGQAAAQGERHVVQLQLLLLLMLTCLSHAADGAHRHPQRRAQRHTGRAVLAHS